MMTERSDNDSKSETAGQHERIDSMTQEANEWLREIHQRARQLGAGLEHLREYLDVHFKAEERGGYFQQAIERAPRLATRAAELEQQHPELMQDVNRVMERFDAFLDQTDQLTDQFRQFSERLTEHEQGENELLQDAYTQDIGSQD